MSTTYTRASRVPGERDVMVPWIDRTATETSLLLRCDHPATVSVSVSGNPFPEVTWFIGARRIQDSPEFRIRVESGGRKRILSISRVTEELNSGIRVEAVNSVGSDEIQIKVKTYKFFTGRSSSELTRSATLPVGHRFRSDGGVRGVKKKIRYNRNQMTQKDYENWEKEMEIRNHMRSIDDIIEIRSDQDSDENPEDGIRRKSSDYNYTSTKNPLPPPPPPPPTSASSMVQLLVSLVLLNPTEAENLKDMELAEVPPSPQSAPIEMLYRGPICSTNNKYHGPRTSGLNDQTLWLFFGTKLSEVCRRILTSGAETLTSARRESSRGPLQTSGNLVQDPVLSRIQTRSLPVERKHLGSQPPKPRVKPPEVLKTAVSRRTAGQEATRDGDPRSLGEGSNLHRSPETTTAPGTRQPPTVRPPLAPKPTSFGEVKSARVICPPSYFRTANGKPQEAVTRSASLPRNPPDWITPDDVQPEVFDDVPVKDAVRSLPLGLVSDRNLKETKLAEYHADKSSRSTFSDAARHHPGGNSTMKDFRTNADQTHFGDSPEQMSVPTCQVPQNENSRNIREVAEIFVDVTKTALIDEKVGSKSPSKSVRKKPPVAKNKPSWSPATGKKFDGKSGPNQQVVHPNVEPQKPKTSVRRARSQSSGKADDPPGEISNSIRPVTVSTSARQLSETDDSLHGSRDGLGRVHPSAAKSEGLLTARKRTASPPGPSGGRARRPAAMPASRSVDVLNASDAYGTPRIGRRAVSKEWQVVTVTTKEEVVVLSRPRTGVELPAAGPPVDKYAVWRPSLGSSRPFAV